MLENSLGYMVSPLGLTERQLLIYQKLYEKCNFNDMTVKYTIEQLRADIRIVDIDINSIYRDVKLMIKKGYLEVKVQGRKGNPSIYRIVRIDDLMRKLNESYVKANRKLKPSNNGGVSNNNESYMKAKGKLSENPIKEKEKEKEIYIYSSETDEYRLSLLLKNLIVSRDIKSRANNCNLQKWCNHIEKLIRIDKRTPKEIEDVINWCQNNSFWCSNILSTEKLRKQFDTLYQQMISDRQQKKCMYRDDNGIREFNYMEGEQNGRKSYRKSL